MRPRARLGVEVLEGKALLTAGTAGLAASLVAVPTTTTQGTSIVLTFTETNVTNHVISVTRSAFNSGFTATDGTSKAVWVSNAGPQPQIIALEQLKPGQSITFQATWDGHSNGAVEAGPSQEGPALKGTFEVANQFDPSVKVKVTLGFTPTHVVPPRPTHPFK